ncbi:hypothetical protein ACIQTZ_12110 [Paenarthrobacter sp. NPDC090520]|uniref:hypothetical protein n=1 Tax=Paenarthrobacter sp. NPDC090520 TaxID=3364382 RepID=UPI0038198019
MPATQLAIATPTMPVSPEGLSLEVIPRTEMIITSETWIIKSGANAQEFPIESAPLASLSCMRKDFQTIKAHEDCLGSRKGCTPAQRAWLEKNAVLATENLYAVDGKLGIGQVTLTNTSKSSQSLSFKDLRWEGVVTPIDDAGFGIACTNFNDWSGGATAGNANSREVLLPSDAGTGIFGGPSLYGEDLTRHIPAGRPAVFNLAAGETSRAQLDLKVAPKVASITGRALATVIASDGEKEVQIPLPALESGKAVFITMPMPLLAIDGGTACPQGSAKYAARTICSIQQLMSGNHLG